MRMKSPVGSLHFNPKRCRLKRGELCWAGFKELLKARNDFGFETTLATRSYATLIADAKKKDYSVTLIYFWLESVDLAKARVKARVEKGGHNIPLPVIERRYKRGLNNFFTLYKNIVDTWIIYDNSNEVPALVAVGKTPLDNTILNTELWAKITSIK